MSNGLVLSLLVTYFIFRCLSCISLVVCNGRCISYIIDDLTMYFVPALVNYLGTNFTDCSALFQILQKICARRRKHYTSWFQGCTHQFQCTLLMIIFLMNLLTWYSLLLWLTILFLWDQSCIIVLTISGFDGHSGDIIFPCCMTVFWSTLSVSKIYILPTCLFFGQWQRFHLFIFLPSVNQSL